MKTQKISLVKPGFKEAKNKFVILSLPISFFAILTIACLVIGFIAPLTLVLTVPFIVIPSFFSISAINTIASNPNTHEGVGFFVMFRAYFSQIFRGGYKVLIGLLKTLLVYLLASVIITAILMNTVLNKDPEYIAVMEEVNSIADVNKAIEIFTNYINTNKKFNDLMFITNISAFLLAFYVFMHHFAVNSFKYNYNFLSKMPLPMHDLNIITRDVMRKNAKLFYSNYYRAFWFLGIILMIGYALGSLLSFFFIPNIDMVQATVVGMFGSFILLLLFIPYFLNASLILFTNFREAYYDTLINLTMKSLDEMKKANQINDEKEKEILNIIESQKIDDNKDKKDNDNK